MSSVSDENVSAGVKALDGMPLEDIGIGWPVWVEFADSVV